MSYKSSIQHHYNTLMTARGLRRDLVRCEYLSDTDRARCLTVADRLIEREKQALMDAVTESIYDRSSEAADLVREALAPAERSRLLRAVG